MISQEFVDITSEPTVSYFYTINKNAEHWLIAGHVTEFPGIINDTEFWLADVHAVHVKSSQVAFNKKKQWQSHCMYTMSKQYTMSI